MTRRVRLLAGTTNQGKLLEIRRLLTGVPCDLTGLDTFPSVPEPEETGASFEANARIKALAYSHATGLLTVAEDSGLVIDALDGAPGIQSARYLSPDATYPQRFNAILSALNARPERPRTARFVCALAVAEGDRILFETRGALEGEIAAAPAGIHGFGYDPIFYVPALGCTTAEMDEDDKLAVAHRGQAFRVLGHWLSARAKNKGR
ncbi:MAG: RdgB/HAM1 family non-canonical purine NTP pyrophosphatase [Vicinamibacterales bacterium]|nr:RdgB/HAM1 family non-canonical purine NTP pyrophosphatase [Vicinamibacterales bacterium]